MASTFRTVGSKDMTVVQICQEYTSINPAKIHKPSFVLIAPTVLTFVMSMQCSCKELFSKHSKVIQSNQWQSISLEGFTGISLHRMSDTCRNTRIGNIQNYMKPYKCWILSVPLPCYGRYTSVSFLIYFQSGGIVCTE